MLHDIMQHNAMQITLDNKLYCRKIQ